MSSRIPNGLQCAPASAEVRAMRQACLAGLDVTMSGEQPPTPQQRQRQPPQRFSPADYASPTVDRPERKRELVLEPRSPPTSAHSASIVQSFPAPPVQHCAAPLPAAAEPLGGTSGACCPEHIPLPVRHVHPTPSRLSWLAFTQVCFAAHKQLPPRQWRACTAVVFGGAQAFHLPALQNFRDR